MEKKILFFLISVFLTVTAFSQENLLLDGDFESGDAWYLSGGVETNPNMYIEFGNETSPPKYGEGRNLRVHWSDLDQTFDLYIYQKVTLTVGSTYEFSGAFKDAGSNPDSKDFWQQIVVIPVNGDNDMTDGPDWSTYGTAASILLSLSGYEGDLNANPLGMDTTYTVCPNIYDGMFLPEKPNNYPNQGDTTVFTVPQYVETVSGFQNLGDLGSEVDFYFILYLGQWGANATANAANDLDFTFDEFRLNEVIDNQSPTVEIYSSESDTTSLSIFTVSINFNEAVTGFELSDIIVGNGTASNLQNKLVNKTWTADITPAQNNCEVTVDVAADAASDAAGNGNIAAEQFSIYFNDDQPPTVEITSNESDTTALSLFTVSIIFNEAVTGFELSDIIVENGTVSNLQEKIANTKWTADIMPLDNGEITVDISANAVSDAVGNGNLAAEQFSIIYDEDYVPSFSQSEYEEIFTIPEYDASNPEHFLISSDEDWSHINDPDKRFFYVKPGDYRNAGTNNDDGIKVELTASGTENARRYISLYNGNDTHPGKLDKSQLACVGFYFNGANYWVIDRMAYWDAAGADIANILLNSSYNIINRYFSENVQGGTIVFRNASNNNTFQNSRIQRTDFGPPYDRGAIEINHSGVTPSTIKNNKILNNEVVNLVDAFQAVKVGNADQAGINYEGTIVDYNHFYITDAIYTDCAGNHNANGNCAEAENAIDLKSGSDNPDNPMIISNNKMWGFRKSDATNSYIDDAGVAFGTHYDVKNIVVKNNLIWDAAIGVYADGPKVDGYSMENAIFRNNVILDIQTFGLVLNYVNNLNFDTNIIKEVGADFIGLNYWGVFNNDNNVTFINNQIVNTQNYKATVGGGSGLTILNNEYYNSQPGSLAHSSDIISSSDPTITYKDLVFITDRYTLNPRTITIPNVGDFISSREVYIPPDINTISQQGLSNLIVYPNPSNGTVNILLDKIYEDIMVEIYSITGQALSKEIYSNSDKLYVSMNYLPGMYFIKISSGSTIIGITKINKL